VCGSQTNAEQLRLAAGRYATTVNIHNPNDEDIFFFKKLAVSFPPAEQKAGDVMPIGIDSLAYDHALKVDCEEIRTHLFNGSFPKGYVEGFLIVQSPRSLDVTAIYTTAAINADGRLLGHSSIDVERVAERRRDKPQPAADLVVRDVRVDLICGTAVNCKLAIGYEVANIGDGPAGSFEVAITAAPGEVAIGEDAFPGLAPAESIVKTFDAPVPQNVVNEAEAFCAGADLPDDAVSELDETNNQSCLQMN
jgi:CARDB